MPGGDPRKCRETAVYPGKAWHKAMQGGWVGFEMKPQVWVKARSKTANAYFDSPHALNTREKKP